MQSVLPVIKKTYFIFCLLLSLILVSSNSGYAQLCPTRPTASFTFANDVSTCLLRNVVRFTSTSTANGAPITSWRWEFGDGETDNSQNPTHTYRTYGKFNVKLTVASDPSCPSTSPEQEVSTLPTMRPDFDFTAINCPNVPVTFTDKSATDNNITIGAYILNYGDGSPLQSYPNTSNWQHTYTKTGRYPVVLSLRSADGSCVSDISVIKYVDVTAVSFAVCQSEFTQFTDETDPTGTRGFTYQWDFDDPAGSTLTNLNTSQLQNPVHRYTIPGTYTARLTVSSPNGCVDAVTTRTFTVRSIPVANFDIENKTSLCGTDSVTFVDKTLAGDNVTELVWYYDLDNRPTQSISIPKAKMRSDKKYRYFYGINNTSTPITYKTRLVARVGQPCPDPTLDMDVVIYPTPVVSTRINGAALTGAYALCAGANAVTLSATANVPGTASFSGTGVVNSNTFDPIISGVGNFTITCVYTGDNTPCISTTTFNIIVGSPTVSLPATFSILEGKPTQFNPTVTGNGTNLTFAWSPATGVSDPTVRNPVFSPSQDTQYTLEVTSAGGCKTSATVQVNVLKTPVIPNTFTPNNDGINDTWNIQYLSTYPGATVEVFNRGGARVYYSNGYPKPWDGTTNGSVLPVGVYYYVINPRSGRAVIAGSLTIIK
jgi:gliding motility-associated-like protein